MADVTHSSTNQISGSSSADHVFDVDSNGTPYGYQLSNATVNISDVEHDMYLDGQSILSDGTFVVGTTASKKIIFAPDSTPQVQITTDGALDLLSGRFLLNGTTGNANQILKTDGYGNLSWTDQPSQQYAFGGFVVSGQDTVQAGNLSETLSLVAGNNVTITTDNTTKTITISSSGGGTGNGFSTVVAGGSNLIADQASDTLNIVAGSNVSISTDESTDTLTISASTSGELNQNAFKNVAATGQNTIQAGQSEDTVTFESSEESGMDSRYLETRDKVTLETDTDINKVSLKNNIPKTFSMASKVPVVTQTGENAGLPLRNKFFNVQTTDPVSGGGNVVGLSTRAIPVLQSNGTTIVDVLMPAKSDNSTLQLTVLDSSGSDQTIDMEVAE
jgi:hypothetical protein